MEGTVDEDKRRPVTVLRRGRRGPAAAGSVRSRGRSWSGLIFGSHRCGGGLVYSLVKEVDRHSGL